METVKYKLNCDMPMDNLLQLEGIIKNRNVRLDVFSYYKNYKLWELEDVEVEIKYVPKTENLFINIKIVSEGLTKKTAFIKDDANSIIRVYDVFIEYKGKRYEFLINLSCKYDKKRYFNINNYNFLNFESIKDCVNDLVLVDLVNISNYLDFNNDLELIYGAYIVIVLLIENKFSLINILYDKLLISGIDIVDILKSKSNKDKFNDCINRILRKEIISSDELIFTLLSMIRLYDNPKKISSKIIKSYPNLLSINKSNIEELIEGGITNGLYL